MSTIQYTKSSDSIVELLLDAPGQQVNTMSEDFQIDLGATIKQLENERESIKGVIITSGKSTFFAGGDLRKLMAVEPAQAQQFFNGIQTMKANLRRLEKLGRPVVAAINGTALGGGLELALSCHHRICIDDPKIRLGFPEVTLGLLPGAGGVTKTVRLMGIQAAMPFIGEGKQVAPREAQQVGFVDALAPDRAAMLAQARAWIEANPKPDSAMGRPQVSDSGRHALEPGGCRYAIDRTCPAR